MSFYSTITGPAIGPDGRGHVHRVAACACPTPVGACSCSKPTAAGGWLDDFVAKFKSPTGPVKIGPSKALLEESYAREWAELINEWAPVISATGYRDAFPKVPVDNSFSQLDATRVLDIMAYIHKIYFPDKASKYFSDLKTRCARFGGDNRAVVMSKVDSMWDFIVEAQERIASGKLQPKTDPKTVPSSKKSNLLLIGAVLAGGLVLLGRGS